MTNKTGRSEADRIVEFNSADPVSGSSLVAFCHRTTGERLAHLRTRAGLTLNEAAHVTQISRAELSRLENGTRRISDYHLMKLAAAYKMSLDALRDILDYKYNSRVRVVPSLEVHVEQAGGALLPIFSLSHIRKSLKGCWSISRKIHGPGNISLSSSAYAIELDTQIDDTFFCPNSLVIADPEKRTCIGDLVLNSYDWSPPVVQLYRDEDDVLAGKFGSHNVKFGADAQLGQFAKLVAYFPYTEQWESLIATS